MSFYGRLLEEMMLVPEPVAPGAFADEPNDEADWPDDAADRRYSGPAWRCVACDSTNCEPVLGGWSV